MKKIFFSTSILIGILYSFIFTPKIYADDNFRMRYLINYDVAESGLTTVTYQINATNLTTRYYINEYDLIVPSTKIANIIAADRDGTIIPQVATSEINTKIHLKFNETVVGRGNTLAFYLSYVTPEIAQKNGRIWEINLPPKTNDPQVTEYAVSLKVPKSFGQANYIFPKPQKDLIWKNEEVENGVTIAYGDYQLFKFHLKYHLSNPKIFPIFTEITLPSDNAYQRLRFERIEPQPVATRQDEDGNWLARYDLSPGEKLDVEVLGIAKVLAFPDANYLQTQVTSSKFLSEQKYWEVSDSEIQKIGLELKTPKAIYDFVVSTLKYDYEKVQSGGQRVGAKEALKNPTKAICVEFTDLFIALARAAGIPAREVDGFAFTTNSRLRPLSLTQDILHAWPEYWDSQRQTWVMIDPTWAATTGGINYFQKLDFNHFALAIKGISSESPLPAGSFKLDNNGKDVNVEFSLEDWKDLPSQFDLSWDLPSYAFSVFGLNGALQIKNSGLTAAYAKNIVIDSSPSGVLKPQVMDIALAPGERRKIDLQFIKMGWLNGFGGLLVLNIDGRTFTKPFKINPLGWIIISVLLFLALSVIFLAIIWKRKWPVKNPTETKNGKVTHRKTS